MRSQRVAAEREATTAKRRGVAAAKPARQKKALPVEFGHPAYLMPKLSARSNAARAKAAAEARARKAAPPPPAAYAPGHFTAPCRAWFGEDWKPYAMARFDTGAAERSRISSQVAEENRALHRGFGNGTIDLPNTPVNPAPTWMA